MQVHRVRVCDICGGTEGGVRRYRLQRISEETKSATTDLCLNHASGPDAPGVEEIIGDAPARGGRKPRAVTPLAEITAAAKKRPAKKATRKRS